VNAWLTTRTAHSARKPEGSVLPLAARRAHWGRRAVLPWYETLLVNSVEDPRADLDPPAGTRWLQKWGKELQQGSRLAYFGLTTLLGESRLLVRARL